MEENRLANIESTLEKHTSALDAIRDTLGKISVQSNQIQALQSDVSALWRKYDDLVRPKDGVITTMRSFQASCPRKTIKWLWVVMVPMGIALLAVSVTLVTGR